MDIEGAIKLAVADGKVVMGERSVERCLQKKKAKAVVYASNAPAAAHYSRLRSVRTYRYSGGSVELGAACGKPFSVSVVAITDDSSAQLLGE
ncbi:MAG: 50S ribosomal protein L30e [Candidatus Thermoplasmatota archaeon]|nr:50S ribosomal protein L30e [Candidatus Sysuiplasma superficiale]MCL4347206.1 50S ribosomal protein L30e [Candidatus Thermoplasmatota archaeon]